MDFRETLADLDLAAFSLPRFGSNSDDPASNQSGLGEAVKAVADLRRELAATHVSTGLRELRRSLADFSMPRFPDTLLEMRKGSWPK